jgi:large subunit ribosomal protein L21
MLGEDGAAEIGAPLIEGAVVRATLVETRKGDKVKVFKKIRRQGYRRTKGHRQIETVLRVTGLEGAGKSAVWDGVVDLTSRATLRLRARGLAPVVSADDETPAAPEPAAASATVRAPTTPKAALEAGVVDEQAAAAAPEAAPPPEAAAETAPVAEAAAPVKKTRAKAAKPADAVKDADEAASDAGPDAVEE